MFGRPLQDILKGYINGVAGDIKFAFRELKREWLDAHEMGFTVMANLTLQDALRDMYEAGAAAYHDFIESRCPESCTVLAIDDVQVVKSATALGGLKPIPALLTLELIIVEHIPKPEPEPEPDSEMEAEADGEAEPEPETEAEPEAEGEAEGEVEAEPEPAGPRMVVAFSTLPEKIQVRAPHTVDYPPTRWP